MDTTPAEPNADQDPRVCARAWFALRGAHARVADCLGSALARECGVVISDFEVLLYLDNPAANQVRIGDLGDVVALSQPALSRLVARLEERRLVARSRADDDHRAVFVTLTAAGRKILKRAALLHAACVREHLLSRLTEEEQVTLVDILDRIR